MLRQRLQVRVEALGVLGLCVDDLTINIHRVISLEWRITSKHFVEQNAHSPPVHSFSMPLVEQDLGSDVLWSSANCIRPLGNDLCKTEVNHLQVTICANHDVFWLEISVDNVQALKIFEDRDNLGSVKCSLLWVEVADASVVGKQVTSLQKLGHKVDVLVVLHESIVFHL